MSSDPQLGGLGFSFPASAAGPPSAGLVSKRSGFPAVSTPSVFDEEQSNGRGKSAGNGSGSYGGSTSKNGERQDPMEDASFDDYEGGNSGSFRSPNAGYPIREHEYDRDEEDDDVEGGLNGSRGKQRAYPAGSNGRRVGSGGAPLPLKRSFDNIARGYSARPTSSGGSRNPNSPTAATSPYTTPLLGGPGGANSSFRNSNEYEAYPPSSPGLGASTGKKPLYLSNLGAKHLNLSTSSVINVGTSPLSPSFAASSTFGAPHPPGSASGESGWKGYVKNSKRRIHPLTLGPAFLLGVLVAMSGLFSGGDSAASTSPSSTLTSPKSWMPNLKSPFTSSASATEALLAKLSRPALTSHPSGHVFLDPARTELGESDHPIHALIRNATVQWENLVSRQSTTLPEAVQEYKRRYNRNPPKGFDDW